MVATGLNFPDALADAAYAGHTGNVLLLVGTDATDAARVVSRHETAVEGITVLGGEGVVSSEVAAELDRALG